MELGCLQQLKQQVLAGRYWAALFIPSNTTAAFISAASASSNASSNSSAKSTTADQLASLVDASVAPQGQLVLSYYLATGRQPATAALISAIVADMAQAFSDHLSAFLLASASASVSTAKHQAALTTLSPYLYLHPLQLLTHDMAPVTTYGQASCCVILPVALWIAATLAAAVMFEFKLPTEAQHLAGGLPPTRAQAARALAVRLAASACLMFLAAAMALAVPVILNRTSHTGLQPLQLTTSWRSTCYTLAFLYLTSLAFFSVAAALNNLLGPARCMAASAALLALQLATCEAQLALELCPAFYKVGYGLPLYWAVQGMRGLLFGVQMASMWKAWMVLGVWLAGCCALALAVSWRSAVGHMGCVGARCDVLALKRRRAAAEAVVPPAVAEALVAASSAGRSLYMHK